MPYLNFNHFRTVKISVHLILRDRNSYRKIFLKKKSMLTLPALFSGLKSTVFVRAQAIVPKSMKMPHHMERLSGRIFTPGMITNS